MRKRTSFRKSSTMMSAQKSTTKNVPARSAKGNGSTEKTTRVASK